MRIGPRGLARCQGAFTLLGGLWPLVSIRSFESVFGPRKVDDWLQYTTGGLLVVAGLGQLRTGRSRESHRQARILGVGTAATLLAVDLVYVRRGRISPVYLLDAVAETGWLVAWACQCRRER
ncbi:hypothetical protein [Actinoalloteichus caeruleus]|uniref:Uncharacterized protein n=1 Tax=Actinoalloteichus caeruleus DSM 43889 TaxID=1120930 RepID=A0ABT1JHV8_ACTCY|nr:hypothetical protein [Actinoalloteichus caeruleus]MCP2332100.1 hypothetical protein [Actinoalloteichus caeruleus DSM 43889]